MIDSIIAKLESLHAASTSGEWLIEGGCAGFVFLPDGSKIYRSNGNDLDAEFITAAHNHLPALLAEVRRLQQELRVQFEVNVQLSKASVAHFEENKELKVRIEKMERALGPLVEKIQVLSVRMNRYGPGMPVTYSDAMWSIAREAEKILEGGDE